MPESSIELRGADGNSDAIAAFAAVSAAYEAFNNGEEAVWLEVRAAPQIQVDAFALSHMAELMAAHAHLEVDHCDYVGFDEYPVEGHQGYRPVEAHQFRCDAVMTDAFTDAAGINVESNIRWLVANGRVRDASSEDPGLAEREGFVARFFTWLSAEHPEINSQDVPAALDLLDEFIASDDRYPLSD